jgi:hypothetical protein
MIFIYDKNNIGHNNKKIQMFLILFHLFCDYQAVIVFYYVNDKSSFILLKIKFRNSFKHNFWLISSLRSSYICQNAVFFKFLDRRFDYF